MLIASFELMIYGQISTEYRSNAGLLGAKDLLCATIDNNIPFQKFDLNHQQEYFT
jgi:hypothetical protein